MIVRMLSLLWVLVLVGALASYLFTSTSWPLLIGIGGVCVAVCMATLKEKWRRKKQGYWVFKKGGAEDGVLFYNERGQILQLYFNRRQDTIYVPSDLKWKTVMPNWAKERKSEIISRVKQLVGKRIIGNSWTYEETDNPERIVPREGEGSE